MHLFYQPELLDGTQRLTIEESVHAIRVMRLSVGAQAEVTDGKGTRALVELTDSDKRGCGFKVLQQLTSSRPRLPNMAIAPTKNMDRMEWFLEKAVEIGVGTICPILCSNSERRVMKTDRCSKVMLAAMKQSRQDWLPTLMPLTGFNDLLNNAEQPLLLAHCRDGDKRSIDHSCAKDSWILIGPEGDFTAAEVEAALRKGAMPITLGTNRLRTETAGIFALSVLNHMK